MLRVVATAAPDRREIGEEVLRGVRASFCERVAIQHVLCAFVPLSFIIALGWSRCVSRIFWKVQERTGRREHRLETDGVSTGCTAPLNVMRVVRQDDRVRLHRGETQLGSSRRGDEHLLALPPWSRFTFA